MNVCTTCGRALPDAGGEGVDPHLVDLARVRDLAEAGYLVDLLEEKGIRVSIRHEQCFDALSGAWALAHYLQCEPQDAEAAAMALRSEADAAEEEQRDQEPSDASPQLVWWKGATLALATGCFCFLLGQRLATQTVQPAGAEQASRLTVALAAVDRPFYTTPDRRGRTYRLAMDDRLGLWRLAADRDGDGEFETSVLAGPVAAPNP